MNDQVKRYLAEIGRRGGTRSRRTLSGDDARRMVRAREARRRVSAFEASRLARHFPELPGLELVRDGIADLANARETESALLVSMAAPRLNLLGVRLPPTLPDAERRLQQRLLASHGDGAHARYNALVRRMVSFQRAAACVR
jgi:hypothetical protein